jgi:site-specific DNA-methyltransferase (adenine-specific)
MSGRNYERTPKGDPITAAAAAWSGWGTALKPALEPITVARKPLAGTVAENVLAHGTGALNIDGCRVCTERLPSITAAQAQIGTFERGVMVTPEREGRWPANLIHDGSDEVVGLFPQGGSGSGQVKVSSGRKSGSGSWARDDGMQRAGAENTGVRDFGDTGSAARFFYCAKASRADRGAGNSHPTVKPTDLMRYLCRLVTPPGGVVLDPFAGSGSTGKAAALEGFRFIGIEREAEYVEIARARIASAEDKASQPRQAALFQEAEA